MRILHVSDTSVLNYDGISTYIHELLECSEQNNDEALVLTTHALDHTNKRALKFTGNIRFFPSIRFPGKPKFITVFTFGIRKVIKDFNPDVIWIHTIGTLGVKAARIAGKNYKVVYTKHCFDGELWSSYLNAPKVIEPILYAVAEYFENNILKNSNTVLYHIGDVSRVENTKFFNLFRLFPPPLNERFFTHPLPERTRLTENKITLGFCGRCDMDKGIREMFDGIEIFHHNHPSVQIDFHFIGDGPEAHYVKQKYSYVNVHITGYINNVIPHLDKLDAFILSSKQETISLSSLEAYARKKVIFSVRKGYLSERSNEISNFFHFEGAKELASLIEKVFVTQEIPISEGLEQVPPIISYMELYKQVHQLIPMVHLK